MKIEFIYVESQSQSWSDDFEALYVKKISSFFPCSVNALKAIKLPREKKKIKIEQESDKIIKSLKKEAFVVLCDERGKELDSIELSKKLIQYSFEINKDIQVVIGGAFGVSDKVKARADLKLKLSSMVMNHHVAKSVVMEQIFRSLTLYKNIPYHNV